MNASSDLGYRPLSLGFSLGSPGTICQCCLWGACGPGPGGVLRGALFHSLSLLPPDNSWWPSDPGPFAVHHLVSVATDGLSSHFEEGLLGVLGWPRAVVGRPCVVLGQASHAVTGPVWFAVPVRTLPPQVLHAGLGHRAQVDGHSPASAAAVQR